MKNFTLALLFISIANTLNAQIIISRIEAYNISTTGFNVSWTNNQSAASFIRYGTTPNLELGTIEAGSVQNPNVSITGGFPAQIYYVQAVAQVGSVVHQTDTLAFITASNSSGEIKVYFNRPVNTNFASSSENHAIQLPNAIDDTLIAYINRAQHSIDIMVYNLGSASGISDMAGAINQAYLNGVAVRVVYNQNTGNAGIAELHPDIPRIISPTPPNNVPGPMDYGIMHNKVFIFDAFSSNPNRPIVWTGSTNLTTQQVNTDPNNVIIVQDQSLAKAYTLEFEEMWGSNILTPDPTNARFGPFKKDNTPHYFNIGGRRVECYFSPSDNTNARIIQAIGDATFDIFVNTMLITRTDIGNAMLAAHNSGVQLRVLIDHPSSTSIYNDISAWLNWRLLTYNSLPQSGILHHKLLFADALGGTNPFVLTGSHNWSSSAQLRNDENTLIIYDADIVNQYLQEFMGRLGSLVSAEFFGPFEYVTVYPNPANNEIHVNLASGADIDEIRLVNTLGSVVQIIQPDSGLQSITVRLENCESGVYFLQIRSSGVVHVEKFVLR